MMIKNTRLDGNGQSLPRKIRHQVEETDGSFEFEVDELDENLEICIQSYSASSETPSRVSIIITATKSQEDIDLERLTLALKQHAAQAKVDEIEQVVKTQTSRISSELMRMKKRTETIVQEIDYSKQREAEFQSKSISLNKAVTYYPIARILIIIMAACMQVSYVVDYMRSKHIY
jgi:emp24/gp25L/p24 family/GOLD